MNEKSHTHTIWSSKTTIFLILCALIVSAVCLSGCVSASDSSENTPESQTLTKLPPLYKGGIYVYIDPDTGVNYLVFYTGPAGGMCPRYNADGTLYISEVAA